MNPMTVFGVFGGMALVVTSIWATAHDAMIFVNLPGLLIVLGGTVAATLVSFPPDYVFKVWRNFVIALRNERLYDKDDVEEIVRIAKLWKGHKVQMADEQVSNISSPFLRTGLSLVLDGSPIDDINELLEWRIARLRARENAEANVFRAMGSYAPAFGMLGTLLGLVNMLYDMSGGSFETLGLNMAVALITTFYGLVLSNLLFKPIAMKLEDRTEQRVRTLGMALEAVNLVSQQRSPSYVRETLFSFISEYDDEVAKAAKSVAGGQPAEKAEKAS
jgi:chemotaxis protein MotA